MILVTGATGKVGTDLVEQLVGDGQAVRALVRDPQKAAKILPAQVELARGDLADAESIEEALAGTEKIFLLCPPSDHMLDLERTAIAAAQAAAVKHLVKLSVLGADSSSRSFFLREHGHAEKAVRDSGIPFTFLRCNFFMQNFLGMAASIKSRGAMYQPAGEAAASHIDTADIAAVASATLTRPGHEGQAYTLTGPQALTMAQVADIFSRVLNKSVKYIDVPRDPAKQSMLASGMPEWQAEAISQLMDDFRAGKMQQVSDDVRRVTGRPPRTLEQFVQKNRAAFL